MPGEDNFFTRWARRPAGVPAEVSAVPAPPAAPAALVEAPPPEPPPTLQDVAALTTASDFKRFVTPEVAPEVRNAALKTLFSDPHFNVMDGLDTYIDDYNKPDPLPEGWLRKMVQSQLLGLFADEDKPAPAPGTETLAAPPEAAPAPTEAAAHEDPDLQLQPDDDAGCAGPAPGPGEDAGCQP